MKNQGLLDGFPLHLLLPKNNGKGITLVLRDDAMGRMQFGVDVEGQRRVVVVASPSASKSARDGLRRGLPRGTEEVIFAAIEDLPFAPGSVGEIVLLQKDDQSADPGYDLGLLQRLLTPDGAMVVITPRFLKLPRLEGEDQSPDLRQRHYVFPMTDREYFVVREPWARPAECPFIDLPLGGGAALKKTLLTWMFRAGLARFTNCATVDVHTGGGRATLVHEILRSCRHGRGQEAKVGLFARVGWNAMLLNPSVSRSIVKLPMTPFNRARMAKSASTIQQLGEEASASLGSKLPKLHGSGEIGGQTYWEESLCEGIPASRFRLRGRRMRRAAEEGCDFLIELQGGHEQETQISAERFRTLLPHGDLDKISEKAGSLSPGFSVGSIIESLEQVVCGRRVPLVRTHGDFWPGNLLVNRDGGLSAVLDWDASKRLSWPVVDLLHLLALGNKRRGYWYCGPTITGRLMPKRLRSWEVAIVHRYLDAIGVPKDLWVCLNAIYWLERIGEWAQTNLNAVWYSETWLRRNVIDTAPRILDQIHRQYG